MTEQVYTRTHQPRGGMCQTCRRRHEDCSGLPFASMPVARTDKDGTKRVICTEYGRPPEPLSP